MLEETNEMSGGIERSKAEEIRTKVTNKLLCIIINKSTFLYGLFYGGEVGVRKDHVCCQLGHISPAAHCYTNVSFLQSRSVIDAITRLSNHYQDMRRNNTIRRQENNSP